MAVAILEPDTAKAREIRHLTLRRASKAEAEASAGAAPAVAGAETVPEEMAAEEMVAEEMVAEEMAVAEAGIRRPVQAGFRRHGHCCRSSRRTGS